MRITSPNGSTFKYVSFNYTPPPIQGGNTSLPNPHPYLVVPDPGLQLSLREVVRLDIRFHVFTIRNRSEIAGKIHREHVECIMTRSKME